MTGYPGDSRDSEAARQPLRVQTTIADVLDFLRPSLPGTIEVRRDIDPRCGAVLATPVEIRRILMNLCTNALHAMRGYGGVLRVSLTEVQVAPEPSRELPQWPGGSFAKLVVEDTGHGMDQETLARIFEANDSSEPLRGSQGMGLRIVHRTVNALRGVVSIQSRVEDGTRVEIFLPLCKMPADRTQGKQSPNR
jgi:signal transduction histidine kinase